jgi:TolQ protein
MTTDPSLFSYFINAGPVVKLIMLLLITVSIASWTVIFQRRFVLKQARTVSQTFEDEFWSGIDLSKLYTQMSNRKATLQGLPAIFLAGFKEFARLKQQPAVQPSVILDGVQRGMRIAYAKEADRLEQHLSFLATVGSTSPYVGLLGTVWGIMSSFQALTGATSQATIAMVAPGIAEALVATAMGLFAAIPAVIAYNRYSNQVERLLNQYLTFQEELSSILHRKTHSGNTHA